MRIAKIFAILCALIASVPAFSAVQIFNFTARIDQPNGLFATGTMITGSFRYDNTLTPNRIFPQINGSSAQYVDPSIALNAKILGQSFSATSLSAGVSNQLAGGDDGDSFGISGISGSKGLAFSFEEPSGVLYNSVALPTSFPSGLWQGPFVDPNDDDDLTIPYATFTLFDTVSGDGFDAVVLNITSAVPEPSAWAMMIIGFGCVGAAMRRRAKADDRARTASRTAG